MNLASRSLDRIHVTCKRQAQSPQRYRGHQREDPEYRQDPHKAVEAHHGRRIAQGLLTEELVLRIVYEETEQRIIVVTVYPGER